MDFSWAKLQGVKFENSILINSTLPNNFGTDPNQLKGVILWYAKPPEGRTFTHILSESTHLDSYFSIRPDLEKFLSPEPLSQLNLLQGKIEATRDPNDMVTKEKFLRLVVYWGINRGGMRDYFAHTLQFFINTSRPNQSHLKKAQPWLDLLYHIDRFPEDLVNDFIKKELSTFKDKDLKSKTVSKGELNPKYFFEPKKIAQRWRRFLADSITSKFKGSNPKLAEWFAQSLEKYPAAWQDQDFLKHLATLGSFIDAKGQSTLERIIAGLSSVIAKEKEFDLSFRFKKLRESGRFSEEFLNWWTQLRTVKAEETFKAATTSPRKAFYDQIADELKMYLIDPLEKLGGDTEAIKLKEEIGSLVQSLQPETEVDPIRIKIETLQKRLEGEAGRKFFQGEEGKLAEGIKYLKQLNRGLDRSFTEANKDQPHTVIFTPRPQDILRAGLIGLKACTRPTEPAAGNQSGQPLTRAHEGEFMLAIYKIGKKEVARSHLEITVDEQGNPRLFAERLYADSDFVNPEAFAQAILKDAANGGILKERVHIAFTNDNMDSWPAPFEAEGAVYRDNFEGKPQPLLKPN